MIAMDTGSTLDYKVATPVFEGPLELLLTLIEKRKLFINDISLAKVTDDFIAYIQNTENVPMSLRANFILVASTLVLIKSKSLLPTLSLTQEETASIEDLERRLKIYERMRGLSDHIKNNFGKNILFARLPNKNITPVFSPDKTISSQNIFSAIKNVLNSLPKIEVLPKAVVRKVISLEETIENLTKRITSGLKMSFKDFSGMGKVERVNVIVSFLAMLELVKQGVISVTQDKMYDDIKMETKDIGVPKYN